VIGSDIKCDCCGKDYTPSKFEIHAGGNKHKPYVNILLEDTNEPIERFRGPKQSPLITKLKVKEKFNGKKLDDTSSPTPSKHEFNLGTQEEASPKLAKSEEEIATSTTSSDEQFKQTTKILTTEKEEESISKIASNNEELKTSLEESASDSKGISEEVSTPSPKSFTARRKNKIITGTEKSM